MAIDLLAGAKLTVELAGLPTLTFTAADLDQPPGLITKALRPRITLYSGTTVIRRIETAGDPDVGVPWGAVFALGLVAGVVWLATR